MCHKLLRVSVALGALWLSNGSQAGDLGIHVILSGQVAPGIYGQVQLGAAQPQPPLVYAEPVLIESRDVAPQPVYLHVPPGHARNWRQHCHEYNACNRQVYFVRSDEYSPDYEQRSHKHGNKHTDDDRGRDREEHGNHHDD